MAPSGNAGVVLVPRQPLLLHGADRHAVDDERGRRIVIVGGDAEDLHLSTGSSATRRRRAGSASSPAGSRRSARLASHAKGGSTTKYMIVRMASPMTLAMRGRDPQIALPQPARARQPDLPPVRVAAGRGRAACRCSSCGRLRRGGSPRRSRASADRRPRARDRSRSGRRRPSPRRAGTRAGDGRARPSMRQVVEPVAAGQRRRR